MDGRERVAEFGRELREGPEPSDRSRRFHARLPHNLLAYRSLGAERLPLFMGLGPYRQWYTAAGRWDTRRGRSQHTEEVGSRAPPDDPHPPAEHQLDKGAV